jgi:hypothetical protein
LRKAWDTVAMDTPARSAMSLIPTFATHFPDVAGRAF